MWLAQKLGCVTIWVNCFFFSTIFINSYIRIFHEHSWDVVSFLIKKTCFLSYVFIETAKIGHLDPVSKWIFPTNTIIFHHFSYFPLPKKTHTNHGHPPVNQHGNAKSPCSIGNTSSTGPFSIAMLVLPVRNARTSSWLGRAFELRPFDIDGSLESTTVTKDAVRRCETNERNESWCFFLVFGVGLVGDADCGWLMVGWGWVGWLVGWLVSENRGRLKHPPNHPIF